MQTTDPTSEVITPGPQDMHISELDCTSLTPFYIAKSPDPAIFDTLKRANFLSATCCDTTCGLTYCPGCRQLLTMSSCLAWWGKSSASWLHKWGVKGTMSAP